MSTSGEMVGDGPSDVEPQAENDTGTRMLTDEEIDAAASTDPAEAAVLDAEPDLDAEPALDVAPDSADQDATRGQDGPRHLTQRSGRDADRTAPRGLTCPADSAGRA